MPRSSPSPARSARPRPRRRSSSRSPPTARRMLPPPPTTITGACRCRSPACRRAPNTRVFEIGMNHAGEITPLTKLVRPHVAIVTSIAPVHLEFFGSLEKIAEAKAEIFLGLEPGGAAVINRDSRQYAQLAGAAAAAGVARIVSFGANAKADARLDAAFAAGRMLDRRRRASSARPSPTSSARPACTWCSIRLAVLAAAALRRRRSRARRAGAQRAEAGQRPRHPRRPCACPAAARC